MPMAMFGNSILVKTCAFWGVRKFVFNTNWELLLHYWGNFTLSQPSLNYSEGALRQHTRGDFGIFFRGYLLGEFLGSFIFNYLVSGYFFHF